MNLPTTIQPTYAGSDKKVTTNVREIKFGSNYTQRTADGINNVKQSWQLEWVGTVAQIDELDNFLAARGGWDSFDWTPPNQSTSLKWTCDQWVRSHYADGVHSLTATFEQQFDLI